MSWREDQTKALALVLRGKYSADLYGDSDRTWTQGRNKRPPKTAEEAEHEADLLVSRLLRSPIRAAGQLAVVLMRCEDGHRCLSGACPLCLQATQTAMVNAMEAVYRHHDDNMVTVNAVWTEAAIPYGRLHRQDIFERMGLQFARALRHSGMRAVGGFDISANEHEDGEFDPYFAPHIFGFIPGVDIKLGEMDFRPFFPADDQTPRPLRISLLDGNPAAFAYAFKSEFHRRDALHHRPQRDGSRSFFSTREKPMREAQRVELAIALHRAGLANRIFLHGYDLVASNGRLKIVPH